MLRCRPTCESDDRLWRGVYVAANESVGFDCSAIEAQAKSEIDGGLISCQVAVAHRGKVKS